MISKINLFFCAAFFALLLQSCTRDGEDGTPSGGTLLNVQVNGIDGDDGKMQGMHTGSGQGLLRSDVGSSSGSFSQPSAPVLEDRASGLEYRGLVEIRDMPSGVHGGGALRKEVAMSSPQKTLQSASSSPLPSGVKYRLQIYNTADKSRSTPVVDIVASVGSATQINIDAGKSYDWFAFSINDANVVPQIVRGVVSGNDTKAKDVLLGSGTINTVFGENLLNITFQRKTSRYEVVLDASGMFGGIDASTTIRNVVNASGAGVLKYGDLNIFTGNYSNIKNYDLTGVLPTTTSARTWTYNLYSVDNSTNLAANALALQSGNIRINKSSGFSSEATVDFPASTLPFSHVAFKSTIGSSYKLSIQMIESPVTVAGVRWARTNLVFSSPRSLMANPESPSNRPNTGAAAFTTVFQVGNPSGSDPCLGLAPQGTWRLPTVNEVTLLTEAKYFNETAKVVRFATSANNNGGLFGIEYKLDAGTVVQSNYPQYSQKLFFPLAGVSYITAGGIGGYGYAIRESSNEAPLGRYWARDANGRVRAFSISVSKNGAIISDWKATIIDQINDIRYSVRCVRAL
ncbi:hypothetical protein [Sphingobacterium paludis]|uniref:Fimbrillin-like protein n=1 Tax=Sphingobacterium paludis TaxID=1476465 RepID=A0A4R7CWP0_9SPHI|nr:hypothetical protein [Sphingobacterium paludis]TDS08931.1 hypothetical protein B0I21_11160 [Sphingobacterium paludis]